MLKKRTSLSILFVLAILAASSVCQSDVSVALSKILPAAAEADVTAAPDLPAAPVAASVSPATAVQAAPPAAASPSPASTQPQAPKPAASVSRGKSSVPAVQPAAASPPQEGSLIDTSNAQRGLIRVNYTGTKGKLRITKNGVQYTYDLYPSSKPLAFPLQLGSGQYSIAVYDHIEGKRYRAAHREEVQVAIADPAGVYLHKMQLVDWQATDAPIKVAAQLARGLATDQQKLVALHDAVIKHIDYDYEKLASVPTGYIPSISQVWADGSGICYDHAVVLAAMLRSQGIPTKLVKGYSPNIQGYHAWNEVYLADEGRWVIIDPTYDSQRHAAGRQFDLYKPRSQYQKVYEY